MALVRKRNAVEILRGAFGFREMKVVLEARRDAERYGWHHEAWKWAWIFIRRISLANPKAWKDFIVHFRATEYPLFARFARLLLVRRR